MTAASQTYDAAYFAIRERSPTFQLELYTIRRALARRGVLCGRILEVGAGSGALARYCGRYALCWIGAECDLRHFAVDRSQRARIRPLLCDVSQLPLEATSFDAVVAQHVIEQFSEPLLVLREWAGVLRTRGGVCAGHSESAVSSPVMV
jgi:ubiquinone/menaquinone biosynthesis C-methylase UbiE